MVHRNGTKLTGKNRVVPAGQNFLVLVHSRIWLYYYHSLWLARVQLKGLIRSSCRE
jgi:hypothetical protein